MLRIIIGLIRLYQVCLSPFFGPSCRFSPSCSHYVSEALTKHGWLRGVVLSMWRILRCNPLGRGGHDPVP
ncbi:MAG: membrane protein insertion efficiency factor YidD [Nitrosospira sp.]|nr:membrane protein insertion efficiency factor YidD [Nitrosospira sp.]MDW7642863.1 membrane protein insertion efficiency factor YidD [Nitrosomonadaceae bacterium]MBI0408184.1 membrane protein insertion efficiency factor YidD [Nitrosospira sp.]MBI0415113.1 membrane protein insertion efficiency factor YidD [Nitrosospira sp.]MBI0416257.1 membrane protein insertion efficiency factor YidD [Nitrosospira sp.]